MYNKFKSMKKSTAQTLNEMDKYCDYFEKYKNLLKWEDPRMTQYFFYVLIIAFVVVTFLPLRLFIALGFARKYFKGWRYQQRRQRHNIEICKLELGNLFDDLKVKIFVDSSNKKQPSQINVEKAPPACSPLEDSPLLADTSVNQTSTKVIESLDQLEYSWERILKPFQKRSNISFKYFE